MVARSDDGGREGDHRMFDEPASDDYWRSIWHRRRLVVAITVLGLVVGGLVAMLQGSTYRATTQIELSTQLRRSVLRDEARVDPVRIVQTEVRVLEGRSLRQAVRDEIPGAAAADAEVLGESDVVALHVEDDDADRAAEIANRYVELYIERRQAEAADTLAGALAATEQQLMTVRAQLDELIAQIDSLPDSAERERRRAELANLTETEGELLSRRDALIFEIETADTGVSAVSEAVPPSSPLGPSALELVVLIGALGLLAGCVVALLVDRLRLSSSRW